MIIKRNKNGKKVVLTTSDEFQDNMKKLEPLNTKPVKKKKKRKFRPITKAQAAAAPRPKRKRGCGCGK